MFKYIIIFLLTFMIISNEFLYSKEIRGIVSGKDENGLNKPLPNASINILGTNKGTLTNKDGYFELNIEERSKLIVSYVGFRKDTIVTTSINELIDIVLLPELTTETVIVTDRKPEGMIDNSQMVKSEVITSRGLQKAACCNLSESFQTNPSVDVTFTDAITGAKQIQLLGLAQTYTQLLTEKVPNLQGLASNYGLTYIPGPWMNSIYISKGAASVTTGYESITGQINVDYKYPDDADKLYINLYANEVARFESSIISKYNLTDNLTSAFFVHGNTYNQKIDMNNDLFADIPTSDQFSALARLNYDSENYESKTIIQTLYDQREAGQISFLNNNNPNSWGTNIKVNRHQFFTKNGLIFHGDRFMSLGTIAAFTNHKQISKFGNRTYNAEQNALNLNLIWQSSFDSQEKHEEDSHSVDLGHNNETEAEDIETEESHSDEKAVHNYSIGASLNYNNYLQNFDNVNYNFFEFVPGMFFEYVFSGIENLTLTSGIRADFHNLYGTLITPRLHAKYQLGDFNTFRASVGKGFHNPLPIAENQNILSSSRKLIFDEKLNSEEAWNFGINTTHELNLLGFYVTLNTEYYRTDFINQTIVDMDVAPGEVHFYNLKGKSYSNSFQVDATIELFSGFNITTAYRINDVMITIADKLQEKPLISKDKLFLNLAYTIGNDAWNFDFTTEYNGGGRIPNTLQNPEEYRMKETFPSFVLFHGQITKRFEWIEMYLGAENIGDFKQHHAIIAFDKPFSDYFDSSMIWGPIHGRKIYFGARFIYN